MQKIQLDVLSSVPTSSSNNARQLFQVLRSAALDSTPRMARRHHKMADLPQISAGRVRGCRTRRARRRAHGLRGHRPPLLHRGPRAVCHHHEGTL